MFSVSTVKGSCYISFHKMTFEKILADFCLRPQVILSPKAKDGTLIEGTCFKESNGNNSLWGCKWRNCLENASFQG